MCRTCPEHRRMGGWAAFLLSWAALALVVLYAVTAPVAIAARIFMAIVFGGASIMGLLGSLSLMTWPRSTSVEEDGSDHNDH